MECESLEFASGYWERRNPGQKKNEQIVNTELSFYFSMLKSFYFSMLKSSQFTTNQNALFRSF